MSSGPAVPKGDGALAKLRVSPNAKSTGSRDLHGEASLKPKITAPPVAGRASAGVERSVAEAAGAAPSKVRVLRGLSGKKTVLVDGAGAERVREVFRSRGR